MLCTTTTRLLPLLHIPLRPAPGTYLLAASSLASSSKCVRPLLVSALPMASVCIDSPGRYSDGKTRYVCVCVSFCRQTRCPGLAMERNTYYYLCLLSTASSSCSAWLPECHPRSDAIGWRASPVGIEGVMQVSMGASIPCHASALCSRGGTSSGTRKDLLHSTFIITQQKNRAPKIIASEI